MGESGARQAGSRDHGEKNSMRAAKCSRRGVLSRLIDARRARDGDGLTRPWTTEPGSMACMLAYFLRNQKIVVVVVAGPFDVNPDGH